MTRDVSLIERLEMASEGSRELDMLIHEALGKCAHRVLHREECDNDGYDLVCSSCGTDSTFIEERYTTSIDAAMTLVPEGWGGNIFFSEDRPDAELHCSVKLARSYPTNAEVYAEKSGKDGDRLALSLALCIAALRARSAS